MDAKEVLDMLSARQDRHETKCDERMKVIHGKIDRLTWIVAVGFGVLIAVNAGLAVFGSSIIESMK